MNSVEKLRALLGDLAAAKPESEDEARQLAMLGSIAPFALGHLPDNPVDLDELLLKGAVWALRLRSDGAAVPPLDVLLDDNDPAAIGPGDDGEFV
jgi:hypothetical protein